MNRRWRELADLLKRVPTATSVSPRTRGDGKSAVRHRFRVPGTGPGWALCQGMPTQEGQAEGYLSLSIAP